MSSPLLLALALLTGLVGSLGGVGGASLLVPILVVSGLDPIEAAPLGLLTVGAGSLAAAATQARAGLVHHRLGLVLELSAAAAGIGGALVAGAVSERVLGAVLGVAATVGGVAAFVRRGVRNLADPLMDLEVPGEWPGTLAGQYRGPSGVVPYQARRVPLGLLATAVAGLVSGLSGVGGGFIKTPAMSEIMGVPVKVAAATSTATVGVTAAAGLLVHVAAGRIDGPSVGPVVLGGLVGGLLGARLQRRLPPVAARRSTAVLLMAVGAVVLGRALW